ncbi:MAG: 3-dehydroquinate synthase [Candidatus Izemoplasmataceae bacterium]
MKRIQTKHYPILIKSKALDDLHELIKAYQDKKIFIITDENVHKLYNNLVKEAFKSFNYHLIVLKAGEESKQLSVYEKVIHELLHEAIHKDDLLVAFGGGVIGDLTGFIAATIYRGIDYIQIPTTLLSMVDSSIGGKTAVNLALGKNLIGAFYEPQMVIIDPSFIDTLPSKEIKSGLAEIYKAALLKDEALLTLLIKDHPIDETIIEKAILIKKTIVEADYLDKNVRNLLNFGHTFGHAIEKKHYKTLSHGECVAYGMIIALEIGVKLHITPPEFYESIKTLFLSKALIKEPLFDYHDYLNDIVLDKKNQSNGINFIFLKAAQEPLMKVIPIEALS